MKEKILAELNKKYLGLSKKVLGLIAEKLAATVTEETAIEGAINELEKLPISVKDYAALLQSDGDERVTTAQKKWAAENKPKPTDSNQNQGADDSDPVTKKLAEIDRKLAELDQKEKRSALAEKLNKTLAEKKIPAHLFKGRTPESEDQFDAVVAEIETDWLTTKQELANQGFVESGKPLAGAGGDASKKVVVSDIQNWAKAAQPQPAAKV
ncbi:hypothetical protein ACX0G7_09660 [Flavitalea antarctica]